MSGGTTVQVSFSHKCGQLNRYNAFNVEAMATFPDISSLLCLHVSNVFHGTLFFGAGSPLRHSQGAFAPRMMGSSISPPWTFVHMFSLNQCGPYIFPPRT